MGKRGPKPGSGRSGGAAIAARGGKGGAPVTAALDRLEKAIRAAALRRDIGYEDATALFRRADALAAEIETTVVVMAADYPGE